jgi:hypothetical protein
MLWWDGEKGLAAFEGVQVPLPRKPRVMNLDIREIDYSPGVGQKWVLVEGEKDWRYLADAEGAYIDGALLRMVTKGIEEICG